MDGIGKELCDLQPTSREVGAQGRRRGWSILRLATGSACGHASLLTNSDTWHTRYRSRYPLHAPRG